MKAEEISHLIRIIEKTQPDIEIREYELMSEHTTFKVGGAVRAMMFPKTEKSVVELCRLCLETDVVPLVIGNGSNLLVTDKRLDRLVINTSMFKAVEIDDCLFVKATAGAKLSAVAIFALENSLTGLEFAHGIPGTLGGAVVMNAGAYGGEMKDVLHTTTVFCGKTGLYEITNEQHEFGYRHSRFIESNDIVISSAIKLKKGDKNEIRQKMDELSAKRKVSQPIEKPSAGSTFKRPKDGYAAELIERAGLKGYSMGGAEVSPKHAGFIVNNGNATFDDIMRLIDHVQETVQKEFGIVLEPEVKIIT
ncbi:MAG: UDP-N-acetylmuramate dehydrogenase [Oscillospiraceae bacterium]|nr:UDP-N-acetylmuramate dehydrogenase [Oscillospiraceae bacterium]